MVHSSASTACYSKVALTRCWLATGILLALWHGAADAQSPPTCESSALVQYQIKNLAASDEKVRVSATRTLIENWRSTLPGLIAEIQQLKKTPASTWPESEQQRAVYLTEIVKTILASSDQSIALFRQCDNDRVVKFLIWATRGDNGLLRINAANILANTIDNTTICFILHHLQEKSSNANTPLPDGLKDYCRDYRYAEPLE